MRNLVEYGGNQSRKIQQWYQQIPGTNIQVYVNLRISTCLKAAAKLMKECKLNPHEIGVR